jgi:hypothetical protein
VIRGNDTLTPDGVQYLAQYAKAGVPIILSGLIESKYATANKTEIETANATMKGLLSYKNVHQVPYEGLAAEVAALGIKPRSNIQPNGIWYTRWRQLSNGDDYVFVYNDGDYSNGTVSFERLGTPYSLNAWTGEETQIIEYVSSGSYTTLSFELQNNETRIIKFTNSRPASIYAVHSSGSMLGYTVSRGSHINA